MFELTVPDLYLKKFHPVWCQPKIASLRCYPIKLLKEICGCVFAWLQVFNAVENLSIATCKWSNTKSSSLFSYFAILCYIARVLKIKEHFRAKFHSGVLLQKMLSKMINYLCEKVLKYLKRCQEFWIMITIYGLQNAFNYVSPTRTWIVSPDYRVK